MTATIQFVKRPIPVAVEFAQSPGQMATLEGPVQYQAGDALLTGVQGERWPVPRAQFDSTYEPTLNPQGRGGAWYSKRFMPVTAYQVDEATRILLHSHAGTLHASTGDWVVTAEDGNQWVVAREIFASTYIPIDTQEAKA